MDLTYFEVQNSRSVQIVWLNHMALWQLLEYTSCGADSLTCGQIDDVLCNTTNLNQQLPWSLYNVHGDSLQFLCEHLSIKNLIRLHWIKDRDCIFLHLIAYTLGLLLTAFIVRWSCQLSQIWLWGQDLSFLLISLFVERPISATQLELSFLYHWFKYSQS